VAEGGFCLPTDDEAAVLNVTLVSGDMPEKDFMIPKNDPVAVDPSAKTGQVDRAQAQVSAGLEHSRLRRQVEDAEDAKPSKRRMKASVSAGS